MSDSKQTAGRIFLKKILATAFLVGLLGIASLGTGICQTPGYGEKPDQWAPYENGQYFGQLQKIVSTYRFPDRKISYLHFELTNVGVGPVELFRIPVGRSRHSEPVPSRAEQRRAGDHKHSRRTDGTHVFTRPGCRQSRPRAVRRKISADASAGP